MPLLRLYEEACRVTGKVPGAVTSTALLKGGYTVHSNFLSYSSAAISTTKQEPALCTSAPVVGVNTSMSDSTIATKLMHIDSVSCILYGVTIKS